MANQHWLKREGKKYGPSSGGNKRYSKSPILTILAFVVLSLAGVAVHSLLGGGVNSTLGGQPALNISPAKNVDEKLFLLRMLDDLYKQIPSASTGAKATQTKLGQLRHFSKKVHMYIERRKLDDSLATLFGDYVKAVDAYSDFLANIGKIERDAVAKAERDAVNTGFDAGRRGGSAAAIANNQGYSKGDSAAIGILAAIISAVADSYEKDRELQEVKRQAVRRAARDVQDKLSTFQARAELTAAELTRKNSWKKGEAGFDEEKEDEELRRLSANRNWKGYWKIRNKRGERRPRDPFTKAFLARSYVSSFRSKGETSKMIYCARECVQSARLVPAGDIYDPYRLRFLRSAGDIANGAFSTELRKKGFFCGNKNAAAAYAVQVWDSCLKYGRDPTGDIRERRVLGIGRERQHQGRGQTGY